MKKIYLLLVFVLSILPLIAFSQSAKSENLEFSIYFKTGSYIIDKGYMNNYSSLIQLDNFVSKLENQYQIDSLVVGGTCSIEGAYRTNSLLALRRAESVKSMIIRNYPLIDKRIIAFNIQPENWEDFRMMLKSDNMLPYRESVMSILDMKISLDEKEHLLRSIHGNEVWKYLVQNYFNRLRNSRTSLRITLNAGTQKDIIRDTVFVEKIIKKTVFVPQIYRSVEYIEPEYTLKPLFALKTNLLYDAVTALNIGLEVPIGKRWSIAGEWISPWWLLDNGKNSFQILNANIEGKYWFGKRDYRPQLTGWFMGLTTGIGRYDIKLGDVGNQGEFFMLGLTGGYAHTINKTGSLRLEYSLGLGYLRARNTSYTVQQFMQNQWSLVCKEKSLENWYGPIKAQVSLVWLINKKVINKGAIR